MKLTAFVSGKIQEVGYRARIVDIANALGLKGMVENQKDGRVKIIAEGEDKKLKWFESAIDIKNTLIYVSSIEMEYSPACNEFDNFGKIVLKGEIETWLDIAPVYLKELVFEFKKMNDNLGGKMDQMIGKQVEHLDEVRNMNRKFDKVLENDIVELKNDMVEVKAALREKGII